MRFLLTHSIRGSGISSVCFEALLCVGSRSEQGYPIPKRVIFRVNRIYMLEDGSANAIFFKVSKRKKKKSLGTHTPQQEKEATKVRGVNYHELCTEWPIARLYPNIATFFKWPRGEIDTILHDHVSFLGCKDDPGGKRQKRTREKMSKTG